MTPSTTAEIGPLVAQPAFGIIEMTCPECGGRLRMSVAQGSTLTTWRAVLGEVRCPECRCPSALMSVSIPRQ